MDDHWGKFERARQALKEIKKYNRLRNDLDGYLYDVALWGMGNIEDRPKPKDFGIEQ